MSLTHSVSSLHICASSITEICAFRYIVYFILSHSAPHISLFTMPINIFYIAMHTIYLAFIFHVYFVNYKQRQTDRQTDTQTDRHTDRQTDRHTDTERQNKRKTDKETERQINGVK